MNMSLSWLVEHAHSAGLNSSSLQVATQLLRDLPRQHRNALRDFYLLEDDDATVCARYGFSLIAWHDLKGQLCIFGKAA
jgi:hypothetical protein